MNDACALIAPSLPDMSLRQKIEQAEAWMLTQPQVVMGLAHYFSPGVYARELTIPKGTYLTGRTHKYAQLNILSKGHISVLTENGWLHEQAPFTIVSPPGTKRIAYAHSECVWTTILHTDLTDPDEIERVFTVASDAEYLEFEQALLEHQP